MTIDLNKSLYIALSIFGKHSVTLGNVQYLDYYEKQYINIDKIIWKINI